VADRIAVLRLGRLVDVRPTAGRHAIWSTCDDGYVDARRARRRRPEAAA
jgi:hypothetical protein